MVTLGQLRAVMEKQAEEDKQRRQVTVSGDSLADTLQQASIELGLAVKKLAYEVLEQGSSGVFGVGKKPFLILAYPNNDLSRVGSGGEADFDFDFGDETVVHDVNGEVFVRMDPEGVMLRVTAPQGAGLRATESAAVAAIMARTSESFDREMVSTVVAQADGEWIRVGEHDYSPADDSFMRHELVDGDMRAYITVSPPGKHGSDPSAESIVAYLNANGIVSGIVDEAVDAFVDRPQYGQAVLVAEGRRPVNGADARVIFNFQTDPTQIKLKETDGRVDFKELNIVHNVVEGQVLAKKVPAERGTPGETVQGQLIPAKDGRDTQIGVGKNVRLSEDGRAAYAEINGQVMVVAGKLNVEPIYVINGDVDLKTGNILFLGTVVVTGSVNDGFSVKAAGNIEVHGIVGKADMDSEGDIIVHQGITGKSTGYVRSGGNVWAKFIENANVETAGMVVVSDGIINSKVSADRQVICKGKRASIVGGRIRASEEINAKTLGSINGMETILEAGYDPKTKARMAELEEQYETMSARLEEVVLNLTTLSKQFRTNKEAAKEKAGSYQALKKERVELMEAINTNREETTAVQNHLNELKMSGRICASGRVYPGVKINIKDASFEVRNEFKAVTFIAENGIVKMTKYEESNVDVELVRQE